MPTITVRQLRNEVSDVVRRAEAGEELTVTVNGRAAARIVPLASKPRSMPWSTLSAALARAAVDPELAHDLAVVLVDTTDDVRQRWPIHRSSSHVSRAGHPLVSHQSMSLYLYHRCRASTGCADGSRLRNETPAVDDVGSCSGVGTPSDRQPGR